MYYMFKNDQLVELVSVLPIQIAIPIDTFKQHLSETFFQSKAREMEIDETLVQIRVQNLCIVKWTVTEEKKLININLGYDENLQQVKISVDLKFVVSF